MRCPNCGQPTSRLIADKRGTACANCRGLSETGGPKTSNILTRNSERVRAQQQQYEGDMITPHIFDKATGQVIPNPDFVDRFPDQLPTYFTPDELKQAGYSKAGKIYDKKAAGEKLVEADKAAVEYAADPGGEKMTEVIENI